MARIIKLGCDVAAVHRRYSGIHGALFGAASYRLVIDALTGKAGAAYGEYEQRLGDLGERLEALTTEIADPEVEVSARLRQVLLDYARVLGTAIDQLRTICARLKADEKGYRRFDLGVSPLRQDKIRYDHCLSELERLGTELNKLFARY